MPNRATSHEPKPIGNGANQQVTKQPEIQAEDINGSDLLNQIQAIFKRYVILPTPEAEIAVTLWTAATHAAPAWNTAPRLVIRAPLKRCGKSRLLDIIEALAYQPVATVNATPSAIYRLIGMAEGNPPTLLIDEADTIFGPKAGDHEDLRGLLNAGHQRGRPALRYDASQRQVERLDTYAMAALAGIGHMPDTIEDRAVIIPMRRRSPNETVSPYRLRRDAPAIHQTRTLLHIWARHHLETLKLATPDMPLEDRAADTWEALIAIADTAGNQWPTTARNTATYLVGQHQHESRDNTPTQLLTDINTILAERPTISTEDLLTHLRKDPEKPWATYGHTGLNPRDLAQMLREFEITSKQIRDDNNRQLRGYQRADFTDAWHRYLPDQPEDHTP